MIDLYCCEGLDVRIRIHAHLRRTIFIIAQEHFVANL